jgi:5-methylcytosine-specific restriction enzyme A
MSDQRRRDRQGRRPRPWEDEREPASSGDGYYYLDPRWTDPARLRAEREKARKLRSSQWWINRISSGVCHYCGRKFRPEELTMDHVVPLARGGRSNPGNLVPACEECNQKKKLNTPVDELV